LSRCVDDVYIVMHMF